MSGGPQISRPLLMCDKLSESPPTGIGGGQARFLDNDNSVENHRG